jgi:hypothetical protein
MLFWATIRGMTAKGLVQAERKMHWTVNAYSPLNQL